MSCLRRCTQRSAIEAKDRPLWSLEGAGFVLQPTLLLFMIFFIKVIEKVKNDRDMLR